MNKVELKEHLKSLHNEIVENISSLVLKELIKKETYFAGGCFKSLVLNEKVNDYDLYFKDAKHVKDFISLVKPENFNTNFELLLSTNNAVTFEFNEKIIQFIIKYSGMPYQVINCFDFLHCQNFYNPTDEYLELKENAILNKELIYNNKSILPISSMKRIAKFASQGWTIDDLEIVKIAQNIASHDLKNKKVLKEQVVGLNFSQFNKNGEVDSKFEERFDPLRLIKKVTNKLKGKNNDFQF